MFSTRTPDSLRRNRLARAVAAARASGRPILDLTESNPTHAGFEYPAGLLDALARRDGLVYDPEPFGLEKARRIVSAEIARRGVVVPPARVALTASTSEAYTFLFKLLCAPAERVLLPRPSYPLLEHLVALEGVTAEPYDLAYHGRWSIDFDHLERAVDKGRRPARAILVVNPNNPTGHVLERDQLARLAAVCEARNLALIGDEVFADYVWPGADAGVSVLEQSAALAFSLGGLSKSAGLPQMKLAWIATSGPDALVRDALARLEIICDAYLSVSTPVQHALDAFVEAGAEVRAQISRRLVANAARLREIAGRYPACRVLHAEAGWYVVIQVPAIRSEDDLVVALVEDEGVLVHPGYFFDFPREAFLVASLLAPEDAFARGMAAAFARASGGN